MESFKEFSNKVLRRGSTKGKKLKITNSYNLAQIYSYCKKHKLISVKKKEFDLIITTVNKIQVARLLKGLDVIFPYIGKIVLYKQDIRPRYVNNKLIIKNGISWGKTLKLWYEDPEAKEQKILVRGESKFKFRPIFERNRVKNIRYYTFSPARSLKLLINKHNKEDKLEAPLFII